MYPCSLFDYTPPTRFRSCLWKHDPHYIHITPFLLITWINISQKKRNKIQIFDLKKMSNPHHAWWKIPKNTKGKNCVDPEWGTAYTMCGKEWCDVIWLAKTPCSHYFFSRKPPQKTRTIQSWLYCNYIKCRNHTHAAQEFEAPPQSRYRKHSTRTSSNDSSNTTQ